MPEITFHGMRHTHGSLLLEHGADPLAVADRLGHSLQVLLNTYRHVLDKRKDRAAGVARSLFGGCPVASDGSSGTLSMEPNGPGLRHAVGYPDVAARRLRSTLPSGSVYFEEREKGFEI